MLTLLALTLLSQSGAAIRRSTPASDDPGMVVRQAGAITVNGISPLTDGGLVGSVSQGPGLTDGGAWAVNCISGCSGSAGSSWLPDGGSIGFMRMPDGGALEVYTVNAGSSSGVSYVNALIDGGYVTTTVLNPVGYVNALIDGGHVTATIINTVTVTGPLTDVQLRASAVPVSAASLPLPAGAATSALQTTGNTSVSSIDTKTPALGQALMASSSPVVIASNQSAVPVSGTVTANAGTGTMAVSAATLPLPSGASTSALQTTGNSSLSSIDTKTLAAGQALMTASSPVVIASNQSAIPTTLASTTITGSVAVTGPLTDAQLRASPLYVNALIDGGHVTVTVINQPTVNQGLGEDGGRPWSVYVVNQSGSAANVSGTLTHNNAAPAADNLGVLPAVASAAAPTYTAGDQVLLSTDLSGALRVSGSAGGPSTQGVGIDGGQAWNVEGTVAATQGTSPWVVSGSVTTGGLTDAQLRATPVPVSLTSTTITGTVAATQSGVWSLSNAYLLDATFTGRFSAGAAAADNFANPTTTGTLGFDMLWDGATWDRQPGNSTDGTLVNLGANNDVTVTGSVTASGTVTSNQGTPGSTANRWPVQLTDGTDLALVSAGGAILTDGSATTQPVSGTVTANIGTSGALFLDATFTGRFMAAAALADNAANPTTTGTAAFQMVWDGATWDRAPGTSTDGQLVNLGANNDVTVTGTVTANAGTNLNTSALALETSLAKLPIAQSTALGTLSGPMAQGSVTTAAPTYTTGNINPLSLTTGGSLRARLDSNGATAAAVPTVANAVGFSDGTNLQVPLVVDTNTAGATQYTTAAAVVVANFGGATQVTGVSNGSGVTGLATFAMHKLTDAVTSTAVTCATTATAAPASILSNRQTLTLYNASTVTIYIGSSAVTTATGIPLLPGASFTDNTESSPYYCRVASGTADLRVLEN